MATIVLAEDDVHIIRVVSMWLKQHKHQVFEAPNGLKALELVRGHRCEVLITDVNMPLMSGIELVRTCAVEGLPRLGTVMLTSRCDQTDIVDSIQHLPVMFHPKPFSPSRLVKEVEELIQRANTAAESQEQYVTG